MKIVSVIVIIAFIVYSGFHIVDAIKVEKYLKLVFASIALISFSILIYKEYKKNTL